MVCLSVFFGMGTRAFAQHDTTTTTNSTATVDKDDDDDDDQGNWGLLGLIGLLGLFGLKRREATNHNRSTTTGHS